MTDIQIKSRKKRLVNEFQKKLNVIREKHTPFHTIEIEISVLPFQEHKLSRIGEHLRVIRNTVLGQLIKNYDQMIRTKAHKRMMKRYLAVTNKMKSAEKEEVDLLRSEKAIISKQFEELRKAHNVTFDFARNYGAKLRNTKYTLPDSVTVWSACEMAWDSVEGLIYRGSKKPYFYKKDKFMTFQGKQAERCIMLKKNKKDGSFFVSHQGMSFPLIVKPNDLFIEETLSNIVFYMENGDEVDKGNVERHICGRPIQSTFRIRNNRIIRRMIRGKIRHFLQVVLEGNPVLKRKEDGTFRHGLGRGRLGGDIGTQSVAIVSKNKAMLKNLAERSANTFAYESKIVALQRKLQRSRRAMNPDYYHEDGRIKKGKREWVYSKRYLKLKSRLRDLHRKAAESRKYAHNEEVNHLRSLGDEIIIETMNIKSLQKKAKEATKNEKTGKWNRRKRFGKSIARRSPGYFISQLKHRFTRTGGIVREVNTMSFKASQYDHVIDGTNKKQLSQRWHTLPCGTRIQRDLYSAFLLYCSAKDWQRVNNELCQLFFTDFYRLHDRCIQTIKNNRQVVLNSGIKY
ncbi:hypothetical protein JSQ81_10440 [Sporosarcina sp. Marseille-Q4063]|uniref:hypothetical protein n=1 Tax=Sporosarcina sp. Marseille-Q4063 TaxID=2810514 RepID=UPI001BB0CF7E|nr:hypothetical protein [Sporosarcina sp. Marseille-Q4063]QUW20296.1 hypothetical protein JSQ81_10440 [Sporosarcina sp. Marseille-Q4063]